MQALTQTQLNEDIAAIQLLHGRMGLDLCKCLSGHTGNVMYISEFNKKNIMIGNYVDILYRYEVVGDQTITERNNVLTVEDIESIIDDCYRELEKYNTLPENVPSDVVEVIEEVVYDSFTDGVTVINTGIYNDVLAIFDVTNNEILNEWDV